jgi:hypothetical protein
MKSAGDPVASAPRSDEAIDMLADLLVEHNHCDLKLSTARGASAPRVANGSIPS